MITLEEKKRQLLVHLVRQLNSSGEDTFFPEALRDDGVLGLNEGQLQIVLRLLLNESSLETDENVWSEDLRLRTLHRLTWRGIQEAEQLAQSSGIVPASDRYVSLSDNQRAEVNADLEALAEQVRGDNEASEEDREIALGEIAVFETTIAQPRISTELVQRFVERVLAWVMKAFSGATLALVAKKLVEALIPLLR